MVEDEGAGLGVALADEEGEADVLAEGFGDGLALVEALGLGLGEALVLALGFGLGFTLDDADGDGEGALDGLALGAGAGAGPLASVGAGGRVTGRPFSPSGLLSSLIGMFGLIGFSSNGVPSTGAPVLAEGLGTVSGTIVGPAAGVEVAPGSSGSTATVGGGGGGPSGLALGLGVSTVNQGKPATDFTLSQPASARPAAKPSRASLDPVPRMRPS